ncbi:TIM-barrel domain-containing protein [Dyella sp.]|jgi:alpha-glucosidase (family GH31 glycosyl hydrolase)|uniref:glycoside hydrolase family 31 protein n=1 Tax=Dyella sp. TaxID=1869338 RepID=UPI002D79BC94|nr:TIM-barrel domain-containing protein [Dyella sp.]HET6433669.1 TIM-barrel domain-containing protein [Dyella sp.]
MPHITPRHLLLAFGLCLGTALTPASAATVDAAFTARVAHGGLTLVRGDDRIAIGFVTPNAVRVHALPNGESSPASIVIDPTAMHAAPTDVKTQIAGGITTVSTAAATLRWNARDGSLQFSDAAGHVLLTQRDVPALIKRALALDHAPADPLYGIGGYDATEDAGAGLLRTGTQPITAGEQGHAGAPLVWSTAGYGVLVDTVGGTFTLADGRIAASGTSRKDLDVYLIAGSPAQIFGAVAAISGRTPLFPKWAMGFTNSQWNIDEKELLQIIDTYRARHIPIDNFTLDFDWKDWGNDWGEFTWNTSKFPDGPGGKLKQMLDARGIKLTGIMKPRVHINTVEGREAAEKGYFLKGNKPAKDYFSGKLVREIDFANPQARTWFFDHMKTAFESGIVGWWNDEADNVDIDTQHLDMQRAIYDGQRAITNQRVWSISRNFYLGAQRYAYGMWSGDIHTGFASMAGQRARMLSAIDVGAMQWGMDTGGFTKGTPSPENYARWIQFGAFVPVFRVHGDSTQKRQPWLFGPVAEQAATDAIRLRYHLLPYIYSYEDVRRRTGVGLVRPLTFGWPDDPTVRNTVASWMFGDSLLVSPVVEQGQKAKSIYLPAGQWTDWFSGKRHDGGRAVTLAIDATHWSDIPLFVRDGAIIPTQPVMDYVGQHPVTQVDVEMFPAARPTSFNYYDDDGTTYDYEHGAYFRQPLSMQRTVDGVRLQTGAVEGTYKPALSFYLFKVHGSAARTVSTDGHALARATNLDALARGNAEGWATGSDRFGPVTYVRVSAAQARSLALVWGHAPM